MPKSHRPVQMLGTQGFWDEGWVEAEDEEEEEGMEEGMEEEMGRPGNRLPPCMGGELSWRDTVNLEPVCRCAFCQRKATRMYKCYVFF